MDYAIYMLSPKKICLITSVFSPYTRGGAESIVANIVNGFKKTNHQISVITVCPFQNFRSLWPKRYEENSITLYRFYPLNLFSYLNINKYKKGSLFRLIWHGLDMFNLHSYFIIKHILKKEKPNVVMTHVLKGIGYLTLRAVRAAKIKNIHTLHDVQLVTPSGLILKGEENSWQHNFFLTRLYQTFNRWLFDNPEIIISSSKFLLEFYNARKFFPQSKKIILTNPINIKAQNSINPPSSTDIIGGLQSSTLRSLRLEERTSKKQENRKEFNFLFLGQVEKYKGVLLLIDVFKRLLTTTKSQQIATNNIKNINLLIVGTGSALAEAKQMAGDDHKIEFLGYIPNQELNKVFVHTDATIVPSLCYENSPTVIFESLSYGVPVLAARIGGIEFIKDNFNGFTFEASDPADLLKILKFSLENKDKLKNMSANCLDSVKEIGVEKYIEKLKEVI